MAQLPRTSRCIVLSRESGPLPAALTEAIQQRGLAPEQADHELIAMARLLVLCAAARELRACGSPDVAAPALVLGDDRPMCPDRQGMLAAVRTHAADAIVWQYTEGVLVPLTEPNRPAPTTNDSALDDVSVEAGARVRPADAIEDGDVDAAQPTVVTQEEIALLLNYADDEFDELQDAP